MNFTLPSTSKMLEKQFVFGAATASFQIEGGAEDRLKNIWDSFCEKDGAIEDGSNGLVACDHYHLWQQDLDLIESLNLDAYRLSLSWPRLLDENMQIRASGLAFYKNILTALKERGIKAFITFYHWDLPQYLEDQGGWTARETAYKFRDYVAIIAPQLKGLVTSYATFNEPFCSAYLGYEIGMHAPGHQSVQMGRAAAHHLLLAHGLAMDVLREISPETENGIVLNMSPCYGLTDSPADQQAAKDADDYLFNWYASPLLAGRYPDLIDRLPLDARPPIQEGDMELIGGPMDYLGLNYYTREVYQASETGLFTAVAEKQLPLTDMGWEVFPQGLTDLLVGLKNRYAQLPVIYITENGCAMPDKLISGAVEDDDRCAYFQGHLMAVHTAIESGVDVRGYFAWSLMDNFEWSFGYKKRFGIVYVDYDTQERIIKKSGKAYAALLKARACQR